MIETTKERDMSTWLTTQQAADALGVSCPAVKRFTRGKVRHKLAACADKSKRRRVYHADDIAAIVSELNAQRASVKTWQHIATVASIVNISPNMLAQRLVKHGYTVRKVLVDSRWRTYASMDALEAVLSTELTPLQEAAFDTRVSATALRKTAKAQDALVVLGRRAYVRREWLTNYRTRRFTLVNAGKGRGHWLNAQQVANMLGVADRTVHAATRGKGVLAQHFGDVAHVYAIVEGRRRNQPLYLFNPRDIAALQAKLDKQKTALGDWVSVKHLAIDTDTPAPNVHNTLRTLNVTPQKVIKNQRAFFVIAPHDAQRVREALS